MRFLCLHGAFTNDRVFQAQLAPLVQELESDGSASFVFAQGTYESEPPAGFSTYFGTGPYYRFLKPEATSDFADQQLRAVRALPQGDSPETVMRLLEKSLPKPARADLEETIARLRETIASVGDIQGILGYSEGAMVAALAVLDERRRAREMGEQARIKCAIFISGWPPFDFQTGSLVLADDQTEDAITVPTCHVMGASDPMLAGAMALYNLCDPDTANIFDHGHGHLVPRDERPLRELGQVIREMIGSIDH